MEVGVIWDENALSAIRHTFDYVNQYSVQNVRNLVLELVEFGNSLNIFPEKFKLCTRPFLRSGDSIALLSEIIFLYIKE